MIDKVPGQELLSSKFIPNADQKQAMMALMDFMAIPGFGIFILRGYAGTGKTTMVSHFLKFLVKRSVKFVLLAPTGRAAKVFSTYSGMNASTIHRKIYRLQRSKAGNMYFARGENKSVKTLFFVDEASMLASRSPDSGGNLLEDLITYVRQGKDCKLILIGDVAQLPPVGEELSRGLDPSYLESLTGLEIPMIELKSVIRQEAGSGILDNATFLRKNLEKKEKPGMPEFKTGGYKDIFRLPGDRLEEGLLYAMDKYGIENMAVLCRSNKSANLYNQNIRQRLLWREEEISAGDLIMVVKNNYFWLPEEHPANFIANGDIAEILKIVRFTEQYGFRFVDAMLQLKDYPDSPAFEARLNLETLHSDGPALNMAQNEKLYAEVSADYAEESSQSKRNELIKSNPFYNALQVKFAYAFTCHKAQGGQWEAVFIDQGYLKEDMINTEYLRWLYTAFTRASKELFLVNFQGTKE